MLGVTVLTPGPMIVDELYWLDQIQPAHRKLVGDKAFYLGMLMQQGLPVVPGVVLSAKVCQAFLEQIEWLEPMFADLPNSSLHLDVDNSRQLQAIARQIRQTIESTSIPEDWLTQIETAVQPWQAACLMVRPSIALPSGVDPVLSSRTRGLLASQSCWNQRQAIAHSLKRVWAELFRAKSLLYWKKLDIPLNRIRFAVLIQPLRSPLASGDIHAQNHHMEVRTIWGLGQALTNGEVTPDRYELYPASAHTVHHPGNKTHAYHIASPTEASPEENQEPIQRSPLTDDQQTHSPISQTHLQQLSNLAQKATDLLKMPLGLEWVLIREAQPFHESQGESRSESHRESGGEPWGESRVESWGDPHRKSQGEPHLEEKAEALQIFLTQVMPHLPASYPIAAEKQLAGLAAAPGQAMAQAWVVDSIQGLTLEVPPGVILVAPSLTPDWLQRLHQIAGVITEQGGMTSHAAILAREIGIPAVLGVTAATRLIRQGEMIWMDGDRGEVKWVKADQWPTHVTAPATSLGSSRGTAIAPQPPALLSSSLPAPHAIAQSAAATQFSRLAFPRPSLQEPASNSNPLESSPNESQPLATQLLITLSQTTSIAQAQALPSDGIGLLRSELMTLAALDQQHPAQWVNQGRQAELIDRMAQQILEFAQAFYPRPVFYRSFDWRSHEFPTLETAPHHLEPSHLEIPSADHTTHSMLGLRGTLSYQFTPAQFDLELAALKQVQDQGYTNLRLILPFVRTVEEFVFCRQQVERSGLLRQPEFQLWIMAEVPSVLFLLPDYVKAGVQGIAIGTNDFTQLMLGVDREHPQLAQAFDQRHPAVLQAIRHLILTAQQLHIPCLVCGQAPEQYPEIVESLVEWGVTGISVSPGAIAGVRRAIAQAEQRLLLQAARLMMEP